MYQRRETLPSDFLMIKANKFLSKEDKSLVINCWGLYQAETLLKGQEIIAIATFSEFHTKLYRSGIVIKQDVSITDLKEIKKFITQVIIDNKADYVYSECVTCKVRDRFHKFLGFEIEKDLESFKKWKFRNLKY